MEILTDVDELKKVDSEPETLQANKEQMIEIVKKLGYDGNSESEIIKAIEEPPTLSFMQYELNPDSQRLFFKLSKEDKKELRNEFQMINKQYDIGEKHRRKNLGERNIADEYKIIHTESDCMQSILKSSRYLVVSRNPVDFLMCSTNQNYGSCFSLTSEYPYALGIPALIPNEGMYVCFFTKGKHANYFVGDKHELKYMKMLARFFAYKCEKVTGPSWNPDSPREDILGLGLIYPKDMMSNMNHEDIRFGFMDKLFKKVGITTNAPSKTPAPYDSHNRFHWAYADSRVIKQKSPWFIAYNDKGDAMNCYFDNICRIENDKTFFNNCDGVNSEYSDLPDNWNISVKDIIRGDRDMDYLYDNAGDDCCDDSSWTCDHCNDCFYDDDSCYSVYRNITDSYTTNVCQTCFDDNYSRCNHCGAYHHDDNVRQIEDITTCDKCFEQLYTSCSNCLEDFLTSNTVFDEINEQTYCTECHSKLIEDRELEEEANRAEANLAEEDVEQELCEA